MTRPNEELAAKFSRVQHAVSQVRGRSEAYGVVVETDGGGRLTALSIAQEALAYGPQALADLLFRLQQHAAEDAAGRVNDVAAELYDDPVVSRLAAMTDSELAATSDRVAPAGQTPPSQYAAPPNPVREQYAAPTHPPAPAAGPAAAASPPPQDSEQWAAYRIAQSRAARARAEAEAMRDQDYEWDVEDTRNRRYS